MNEATNKYFEALTRLVKRKAKINNDTVALEAGLKKGSIKKSRIVFHDLILAIDEAAAMQSKSSVNANDKLLKSNQSIELLQAALDEGIKRELSLVHQLFELKRKLFSQTGEKILPLRKKNM